MYTNLDCCLYKGVAIKLMRLCDSMCFRVVERGRVKCGQYWPLEEGRTEQHGYFLVRNTHIQVFQDFKLSHLELYNTQVSHTNCLSFAVGMIMSVESLQNISIWCNLTVTLNTGHHAHTCLLPGRHERVERESVQMKECNWLLYSCVHLYDLLVRRDEGGVPLPLCQLARLWSAQKCFSHAGLSWACTSEEGGCSPKPGLQLDGASRGPPCGCALQCRYWPHR